MSDDDGDGDDGVHGSERVRESQSCRGEGRERS